MPGSILGNAVRRVEDPDLLTGRGTFIANLSFDSLAQSAFVRSPVAHAVVSSIDTSEAVAMPGVVAVYTAADLDIGNVPSFMTLHQACVRPPLATGRVRFVGELVAVVVAETKAEAVDAAEAVVVDYDPLPVVVDPEEALEDGAPLLFEAIGSNMPASLKTGDPDPLAGADVVVRGRFVNQKIAVVPMEGAAVCAIPDPLTIYISTQMPHLSADQATKVFGVERDDVRVIAPHVGGGFGAKTGIGAEHAVVVEAARKLGRPVAWIESRSENMVSMPHGRGQVQYCEMGFTREGEIVGLRCRIVGDGGGYGGFGGALPMSTTKLMAQGVYRIPKIGYEVAVAVTNTTPTGAYKDAGRPEAAAMLERVMDMAADELGIDPIELRRRNLLQPDQFPYTTLMGAPYDNGEYELCLNEAARLAGYDDLMAEQAVRRERGDTKQLGIGVSVYVEVTGGGGGGEYGAVEIDHEGGATIKVGTSAHGQGHATAFSMIVSDRLGIPMDRIRFIQSDTALVPRGGGTGGSRSLQLGGNAVGKAADVVLDRARQLAAEKLEADPADIVVTDDGGLGVAGVPTSAVTWAELAVLAESGGGEALTGVADFSQGGATFPFGAHLAVVEVDTETGRVELLRHIAVDDCGRILNPLLVAGQQHGGVASGAGQALYEQMVYDADGNPITSTLAEYPMPSAAEFPSFELANTETPTHLNPLGAKGIGESGSVGSTPAVQNAVVDAVSYLGIRHVDMPCTPERMWSAIQAAKAGNPPSPWREPPAVFATLEAPPATAPAAEEEEINL